MYEERIYRGWVKDNDLVGMQVIVKETDLLVKAERDLPVNVIDSIIKFRSQKANETPMGICTSSGTVGHSLSFGNVDAVVVLSKSTILADAAAACISNLIKSKADIPEGIKFAQKIKGLGGVIIIKDDKMGIWGEVKI